MNHSEHSQTMKALPAKNWFHGTSFKGFCIVSTKKRDEKMNVFNTIQMGD